MYIAIAALEGAGLSYEISGAVSGDDYANYSITGYTQEVKKNEPVKLKAKKDITGGTTGTTSGDTTTGTNNDDTTSKEDTEVTGNDISSDTMTGGFTDIFNWHLN